MSSETTAAAERVHSSDGGADRAPMQDAPARTLRFSILVSAVRCTLTYVLLPFVAPFVGLAVGVGPLVGIPLSAVGLWANAASIVRHHRADHRWKWPVSALNVGIMVLLVILMVLDIGRLAGWIA